jgi:excisionase family DNA binding protein
VCPSNPATYTAIGNLPIEVSQVPSSIYSDQQRTLPSDEQVGGILDHIEAAAADVAFERLLMIPEAAELLHMHPKTLQAMARAGTVPCIRMGKYWMFRASSLDEWVLELQQSRRVSMEVIS